MSKLRIAYIASLVVLGVLVLFAVLRPMTSEEKYSEVQQKQLVQDGERGCHTV